MVFPFLDYFTDSIMTHINPCITYLATFRLIIFVCDGGSYLPIQNTWMLWMVNHHRIYSQRYPNSN